MGKGSKYGQLQRTLNKHAGQIDRAIARSKNRPQPKPKTLKEQLDEYVPDAEKAFHIRYPRFSDYEIALEDNGIDIQRTINELTQYCGMNERPRQAYDWFKSMWTDKVDVKVAAGKIKDRLGW